MTVLEAIQEMDGLRPNGFSQEQKMRWLDRLDGFVQKSVLDRYPGRKKEFKGDDMSRELLMPEPFAEGYLHWMEAKIHYYNQEIDRYNSAMSLFRGIFEDYQRELHRREETENTGKFRF